MKNDLEKENQYLREQFYGQQVSRRQAIVQDLIRTRPLNSDSEDLIKEATTFCAFIESREIAAKPTKLGKRLIKAAKAGRALVKKGGKRKYTKRSKFWAKKK